ncbi:sulfite exporter TauE/SafE family protein [Streptomyces qinzhouensis]|uniref:Probable membrane transporter protein n=1 Tax=Streptomyces qinzhouensis TaxID=2599401 RepID=A0A5B8IGP9_9ACTN|nr:sulfite exporter TauE/SafE family protein [Streptomyces qinzhouensis]QDY77718.1 sulfite exporter TauE/SafE family protein [Streptomyces qinzhouensis]
MSGAVLLALVAGAVVGIALGALGGGGSVLAVPALIYLLDFDAAAATTASLVIVAVTSATALGAHARDGHVHWRTGALFAAAGLVPAALGGAVAAKLPDPVLTGAFAVIAAVVAADLLRSGGSVAVRVRGPGAAAGTGAGLGAVTGVLGVGGGFLVVPALTRTIGLGMRAAVGTGLLVVTVNSLAALATRSGTAQGLEWGLIAPFAGAAVLGAWDGKRLADRVGSGALRTAFAWSLAAVAAVMAADAVGVL